MKNGIEAISFLNATPPFNWSPGPFRSIECKESCALLGRIYAKGSGLPLEKETSINSRKFTGNCLVFAQKQATIPAYWIVLFCSLLGRSSAEMLQW
jgi:hypothetical protein